MKAPEPFDERDFKLNVQVDPSDRYLPKRRGFITDCIFSRRGTEIPAVFTAWASLVTLSGTIKRDAWLDWVIEKVYPNLFVLLVGRAGLARKTAAMSLTRKLLDTYSEYIEDDCMKRIKQIAVVSNQGTPEGIINRLSKSSARFGTNFPININGHKILDEHGNQKYYHRPTECLLYLSELGSMLGKQAYTEGLVTFLTDAYDPQDSFERTLSSKEICLPNTYFSLIGGTTPTAFRDSIPVTAKGDGFLSRTIVVYVDRVSQRYSIPSIPKEAPDNTELAKRLAWVAWNVTGEYKFSKDAFEYYDAWYHKFKDRIENDIDHAGILSRYSHHIIKLSMLVRASVYEPGRIISLDDVKDAETLLERASVGSIFITDEISNGQYAENINRVVAYVQQKGFVLRRQLLTSFSGRIKASEMDVLLENVLQQGRIKIKRADCFKGSLHHTMPSTDGNEKYIFVKEGKR